MSRLLVPLVFIIIAGGVFFLFIQPTYGNIQTLRAEMARVDQALVKARELDMERERLETRFNNFDPEDRQRLLRFLPDNIDNVRLIIDIDNIAAQYGLQIRDFGISEQGERPRAEEGSATNDQAVNEARQAYRSVTMDFSITSTYEDFLSFLADLERSLRLIDVNFISLQNGDETYTYSLTIRTYWLP